MNCKCRNSFWNTSFKSNNWEKIQGPSLYNELNIPFGFHAHDNLGLATANSLTAANYGAKYIDACIRGFGAGAGNTQLEVLVAVLDKLGYETGIDLYKILDAANLAEKAFNPVAKINEVKADETERKAFNPIAKVEEVKVEEVKVSEAKVSEVKVKKTRKAS